MWHRDLLRAVGRMGAVDTTAAYPQSHHIVVILGTFIVSAV